MPIQIPVSNSQYLAEANALFSRMTTQPSTYRKIIINETISELMSSGIWTELDAIWFFAAHEEDTALLNWKSSSFNSTKVGSPTFTVDQGFNGGSTSNYLNTNYAPSTDAIKFATASASWGFYSRTTGAGTDWDMGINISTFYLRNNGTLTCRFLSSQSAVFVVSSAIRFTSAVKTSGIITLYKDGASLGSGSAANSGAAGGTITIMTENGTNFSSKQFAFAFVGSSLINQATLFSIVTHYLTKLGANV